MLCLVFYIAITLRLLYATFCLLFHVLLLVLFLISCICLALSLMYFVLLLVYYVLFHLSYTTSCFVLYALSHLVSYAVSYFVFCVTSYLILFVAIESEAMALSTRKYYCSKSLMIPTPSKKRVAATSFIILLHQKKLTNNAITYILVKISRPVSSSFGFVMINYQPLNQFWIMFGNLYSSHYVRSAAN